jgi:predicted transcriptional regulator YheO
VPRFDQEPGVTTVAGMITPFPAGPAVPLQRETNRSQEHYIHALVRRTVERELANIQIDHTRRKEELVQELYEEKRRGHVSI